MTATRTPTAAEPARCGDALRATHPDAFRSGEWATCLGTVPVPRRTLSSPAPAPAPCYVVLFEDRAAVQVRAGVRPTPARALPSVDLWPVDDPHAGYECVTPPVPWQPQPGEVWRHGPTDGLYVILERRTLTTGGVETPLVLFRALAPQTRAEERPCVRTEEEFLLVFARAG